MLCRIEGLVPLARGRDRRGAFGRPLGLFGMVAADHRKSPLSIIDIPQVLKTRVGLSINLTYVSSGHLLTEEF